jgi:hypothetical protein
MDLQSRRTLGQHTRIVEGAMLLGVGELLNMENLKLPFLLDERDDPGAIDVVRGIVCSAHDYGLHCDLRYGLRRHANGSV